MGMRDGAPSWEFERTFIPGMGEEVTQFCDASHGREVTRTRDWL